jgi:hypothetical protein
MTSSEDGMNVKGFKLIALVLPLWALAGVRAEEPSGLEKANAPMSPMSPMTPEPIGKPSENGAVAPQTHKLSSWISYERPTCCGPVGPDGPIQYELYLRAGPSIPIAGGYFSHTLESGWLIQGGGRSLFFDVPQERAWTVDLSISNIFNHGQRNDLPATLHHIIVPSGFGSTSVPSINVTVRDFNRTFVSLGLGREWYPWGAANTDDVNWRIGFDGGGRLGTAKLELNEIKHRTDVIGGAFAALHSDVEVPLKKCVLTGGLRLEWEYTWSGILQSTNDANLMDLNILLMAGIRY